MNSRTFRYRKLRIARWTTRFGKEFPFLTKLEKEIEKGLGTLPWSQCLSMDGIETFFFVFMKTSSPEWKNQKYYYGRIFISTFILFKDSQSQIEILQREIEEILCELFLLIKQAVENGEITGRVWEYA